MLILSAVKLFCWKQPIKRKYKALYYIMALPMAVCNNIMVCLSLDLENRSFLMERVSWSVCYILSLVQPLITVITCLGACYLSRCIVKWKMYFGDVQLLVEFLDGWDTDSVYRTVLWWDVHDEDSVLGYLLWWLSLNCIQFFAAFQNSILQLMLFYCSEPTKNCKIAVDTHLSLFVRFL